MLTGLSTMLSSESPQALIFPMHIDSNNHPHPHYLPTAPGQQPKLRMVSVIIVLLNTSLTFLTVFEPLVHVFCSHKLVGFEACCQPY